MKEQSDTPSWWRCDTHGPGTRQAWGCPECVRELRTSLVNATRECDEARAEVAEMEGALRASGALNQKLLDEVDRLRALTICGCGDHFAANFEGTCPNCIAAGKEPKP